MTISALRTDTPAATIPQGAGAKPRAGLFFVADAGFIRPLRTMFYSMLTTGSLCDLPVTIITTQEQVASDPVIARVADRIRILAEEELRPFREIPIEQVKESYRHSDVPKYSFLKWFVMEDYGYDVNVYLDCDMVCIDDVSALADLPSDADIAVAGRWPQTLQTSEAGMLPRATIDENVRTFLGGRGEQWPWQPNSGVLVLGKRMMQSDVVPGLFAARADTQMGFDQGPMGEWLKRNPDVRICRLPESYNVNQGHIGLMTATEQARALGRVKILHFISLKPWDQPNNWRLPHRYWNVIDREARRFYETLELG